MVAKKQFPPLELTGSPAVTADDSSLSVLLGDNFRLPDSYRAFAKQFGYGLLCDLLIVYIPMGDHGDSITVRSQELHDTIEQTVTDDLFEYEPDGSPELVRRLVPFGISENGHTLAWDPADRTARGEYMIYVIGSKFLAVRKGAPDLYSFVAGCLDERVKSMLGQGYMPLPARFRPMRHGWKPV